MGALARIRSCAALCALAAAPLAQSEPDAPPAQVEASTAGGRAPAVPGRSPRVAETLERWREAFELDLAGALLEELPGSLAEPELAADGELVALAARALHMAGRADEAAELLDAAQVRAETRAFVELERARELLADDDLRAVVDLLKAPRAADGSAPAEPVRFPEHPECWLYVGRALNRAGRVEDSVPFLVRFTALAPLSVEAPAAWHMLAQEAFQRRDVERGRECEERGRELARWHSFYRARLTQVREAPGEPLPRRGLAELWIEVGEWERAKAELARCLALDPDSVEAWALSGEVERKLGHPAAALAAYDRTLELDPSRAPVRFNRGVLHLMEGRAELAHEDFARVVAEDESRDPQLAGAALQLARSFLARGDRAAAVQHYEDYRARGGREPLEP